MAKEGVVGSGDEEGVCVCERKGGRNLKVGLVGVGVGVGVERGRQRLRNLEV